MKGFNYPKTNRKKLLIYLLLIILPVILSGCSLLPVEDEVQTSAFISLNDVDYTLYEVKKRDLVYTLQGTGVFASVDPYNCFVQCGGNMVKKVFAKKGDKVKEGDVLIEFDKGDLEYQLKEEELMLKNAKYNYENACKTNKSADEVEESRLLMSIEESKLKDLKLKLEKMQYRSPVGGIIIYSENLTPGKSVPANTKLFGIADPKNLNLVFLNKMVGGKSSSVVEVKHGTEIKMYFNSNSYKGKIMGRYDTGDGYEIEMDSMPQCAGLGVMFDMQLNIVNKKNIIAIPKKAIKIQNEKDFVVVIENGARVKKDVEVGAENDTDIEIIKGLKEGDMVIID